MVSGRGPTEDASKRPARESWGVLCTCSVTVRPDIASPCGGGAALTTSGMRENELFSAGMVISAARAEGIEPLKSSHISSSGEMYRLNMTDGPCFA